MKYLLKGEYIMSYEKVGRIYESRNFGKFKVIAKCGFWPENADIKDDRYVVRFLDTGCTLVSSYESIRKGAVRDYMKPVVAGVGYVGSMITISDPCVNEFYKPWNDMINRCYNTLDRDYQYYGALGVTVDPRWFNFTYFMMDVIFLPNIEKRTMFPTIYQLDKDYLQWNIPKGQRVYSRDTCIWISSYDNHTMMGFEKENSSGYFGVSYKDNSWQTRINNITYGRFTIPEAAANLFNYIRPKLMHYFNDIMFYNNVPVIQYEELHKYCVGSTTIREVGGDAKWYRSGGTPISFNSRLNPDDPTKPSGKTLPGVLIGGDIVSTSR